jgi:hypothetical protein
LVCEYLNFALEVILWAILKTMREWGPCRPILFVERFTARIVDSLDGTKVPRLDIRGCNTMQQLCAKAIKVLKHDSRDWSKDVRSEHNLANCCRQAVKEECCFRPKIAHFSAEN